MTSVCSITWVTTLLLRYLVSISTVAALTLTILLAGVNPSNVNAANKFKVATALTDVDGNGGDYTVTVSTFSKGYPTLEKTKIVHTGYQVCPDDVDYLCYTPAGLFEFKADKVAKNTGLKICAYEPISGEENCKKYKQTSKWPPTLKVDVPEMPEHYYLE